MALILEAAPYQFVYVENIGGPEDSPLTFNVPGYDRHGNFKRISIAPGDRELVTLETAANAFGHPGARNSDKMPTRDDEYKRLRTLWGFYVGFDTDTEAEQTHKDLGWRWWEGPGGKAPKFRVTTVDGVRIPMVLDDPYGDEPLPDDTGAVDPDLAKTSGNVAVMQRTIEMMVEKQAKQDQLIERLLAKLGGGTGDATDADSGEQSDGEQASEDVSTDLPPVPDNEPPVSDDRPRAPRASTHRTR